MTYQPATRSHRLHWGVTAGVLFLHVVAVIGLIHAFQPAFSVQAVRSVTQFFDIPLEEPSAKPPTQNKDEAPKASGPSSANKEGHAGAEGQKANPKPNVESPSPLPVRVEAAAPVSGQGLDRSAGASDAGNGTGLTGSGDGLGSGSNGHGQGGGGGRVSPIVKIAGDINSAKDYPRASRALRIGHSVTVELSVSREGRVTQCKVVQASPDPAADAITCQLAMQRFRFRPAYNSVGQAVDGRYRWQQRWFY